MAFYLRLQLYTCDCCIYTLLLMHLSMHLSLTDAHTLCIYMYCLYEPSRNTQASGQCDQKQWNFIKYTSINNKLNRWAYYANLMLVKSWPDQYSLMENWRYHEIHFTKLINSICSNRTFRIVIVKCMYGIKKINTTLCIANTLMHPCNKVFIV